MFTRQIHAAFDYAAQCHAVQVRKGTQIPYLSHLMAVASLLHNTRAILTDLRTHERESRPR